jgi:hypothetical protein
LTVDIRTTAAGRKPEQLKADARYCSEANLEALENRNIDAYVATGPAVYCRAVLCYDHRIALDGTPAEPIDGEAKDMAAKQLAKIAPRRAKKIAKPAAPGNAGASRSTKQQPPSIPGHP